MHSITIRRVLEATLRWFSVGLIALAIILAVLGTLLGTGLAVGLCAKHIGKAIDRSVFPADYEYCAHIEMDEYDDYDIYEHGSEAPANDYI